MGSGLTPTQSWPYPLETDTPDVAADMHALALALDVVPKRLSGLASARPTASTIPVGTFFFATDTGILSFCTGAAWLAIEPNLTLMQGVASSQPAAGSPPRMYYATDTKQYSVDNGTIWQTVLLGAPASASTVLSSSANCQGVGTVILTLTITCSGAPVMIIVNGVYLKNTTGLTITTPFHGVRMDGTVICYVGAATQGNQAVTGTYTPMDDIMVLHTPSAGSHTFTYTTEWGGDNTGSNQWEQSGNQANFIVYEIH